MTTTKLHSIVMGGSLGGLTAALSLRDAGYEVDVYERASAPLTGLGAGIVLNPVTVRYFSENEILDVSQVSVATHAVRYMGQDGSILDEKAYSYRLGSYNALYQGLLDCFDAKHYHLNKAVVGFEQDATGVNVRLANGNSEHCDLLVCADGIRSTARRRLLPAIGLEYGGYIAWRGTIEEAQLSPHTFARLHDAITYHILPAGHMLLYPIPTLDAAQGSTRSFFNWLWYQNVPPGAELHTLTTDKDGVRREVSLSPGSVQDQHIAKLQRDAAAFLPPQLAEVVQRTAQPFIQLVFDCEVPHMAFGRICLIGDAAFVARPHAAAGTAKAAEDAWKLAEALKNADGDVVTALKQWEIGQLKLGRAVVARTREAGQRLQFERTWQIGTPLPFGLYEVGDSLMPDPR